MPNSRLAKIKVAMYGLTSEGYRLAADMVDKAQVTIVDETLQMATDVDLAFLKKNPNLDELMSGEPLLRFKPLERVLGDAQVVFFTPRLRRPSEESLTEASTKLRELSRYLSSGATLVNMLPAGPGGNSENIMAVEKQTGLKVGAKAPKFILKDQQGAEHSLDELLKKGKVALVFYRSADW